MRLIKQCFSLWLLAVSAFLVVSVVPTSAQSDAPYIYFYSREDKAFIIERADSSDRQTLVAFDLDKVSPDDDGIAGGGWSPSGRWFTWLTTYSSGGPAGTAKSIYLFDNASSKLSQLASTQDYVGYQRSEWSPTDDLLLLISYDNYDLVTAIVQVYDPATQSYLMSIRRPLSGDDIEQIEWSKDGRYLTFANGGLVSIVGVYDRTINEFPAFLDQCARVNWLSNDNYGYLRGPNSLVVDYADHLQGQHFVDFEGQVSGVYWSLDGQVALVSGTLMSDQSADVWFYDRMTTETKILDRAIVQGCNQVVWSPNGDSVAYRTSTGGIDVVNRTGKLIQQIAVGCDDVPAHMLIVWADNDRFLFSPDCSGAQSRLRMTYLAHIDSAKVENFEGGNRVHAHGDYAILDETSIINLVTREQHPFSPLPETFGADDVLWHSTGRWVFLLADLNGLFGVRVAGADGHVLPDEIVCPHHSHACYGWLPPQVKLN